MSPSSSSSSPSSASASPSPPPSPLQSQAWLGSPPSSEAEDTSLAPTDVSSAEEDRGRGAARWDAPPARPGRRQSTARGGGWRLVCACDVDARERDPISLVWIVLAAVSIRDRVATRPAGAEQEVQVSGRGPWCVF